MPVVTARATLAATAVGRDREPALEIGVDRHAHRAGDGAEVLERLVERHVVVGLGRCVQANPELVVASAGKPSMLEAGGHCRRPTGWG